MRLSDDKLEDKLLAFYTEHKEAEKKPDLIVFQDFSLDSESKGVDVAKRTLTALVSGPKEDRHRDTINPKGWDVSIYKSINPVLLWAHDYRQPPIGKAITLTVRKTGEIIAKFEFAKTEFAEQVLQLYNDGFLNSFSVGFRVLEFGTRITEGDQNGYTFNKQELLEVSAVPVPAYGESQVLRDAIGEKVSEKTIEFIESSIEKIEENEAKFVENYGKDVDKYDKEKLPDAELAAKLDNILTVVNNILEIQAALNSQVAELKAQMAQASDEKLQATRDKMVIASKALNQALRDSKVVLVK